MDSHGPRPSQPCGEFCPPLVREVLDLISAKWAVPIFVALYTAPEALRYAEIEAIVFDITPKELAKNLKQFEAAGLIARKVHPTVPPFVEYTLTPLGRSLGPSLQALADWAALNGEEIARNKSSFNRR